MTDFKKPPCPAVTTTSDGSEHHCWGAPGHAGKHHAPIDLGGDLGWGQLEWGDENGADDA